MQLLKAAKKRTRDKKMENLEKRKQTRQDWDHKAYHDAPSAIYCAVTQ